MVEPVTAAELAAIAIGSYLLGTFPSGFLVGKASGIDIRDVGSGNIGATNVARNLGKARGVIVLVLDALKGALPVGVVLLFRLSAAIHPYAITAAGLGAIVGHCFPVWLRFRGGKGVATSLGVFAVIAPEVTGIAAAVWVLLYGAFRIASIGSIVAALSFPPLLWALGHPRPEIALGVAAAAIVVAKHHGNIRRLFKRQELRV